MKGDKVLISTPAKKNEPPENRQQHKREPLASNHAPVNKGVGRHSVSSPRPFASAQRRIIANCVSGVVRYDNPMRHPIPVILQGAG